MIYAVIGGRDFQDETYAYNELDKYITQEDEIVSGGAGGADTIASRYAFDHHLNITVHRAEWNKHGKAAGFIRNQYIVDDCDTLIAFWDGESKGTENSIELARKAGKRVITIRY